MIRVTYINREYRKTGFSIEGIFSLIKESLKEKIKIDDYNFNPKISWISNILTVGKHAGDINHVTGDVNFLLLGVAGKNNLLTIHDLGHYDTLRKNKIKHIIYHLFWFYLPLKQATYVTVVSGFTKKMLLEYFDYPEDKIRIVYDPVKPIFKFRRKSSLNAIPRILQIGSGKHKNLNNLIEAVKGTVVHLDIIAWLNDELTEKLQQYQISYTLYNGLTDEAVHELYSNADIVFFASFYEGFGMPIIEAQAVGRPVITSNYGAMKEVAGESAVLVDPNNPQEIRQCITKLLTDTQYYEDRVAAGLENIVQFHHEKIARDYLEVYNEMYASSTSSSKLAHE